jgi:hypothetical protein
MRKKINLLIIILGLMVSCIPLQNTNIPVSNSPISSSSPSLSNISPSPFVFTPKKGKGAITGIFKFAPGIEINHPNGINIDVYDAITSSYLSLKINEIQKEQEFIIDDINVLDKQGTDVKLRIISGDFYKLIYTKIYDSKLTDLGTITFNEKDIDYFRGETTGAYFILQNENGNPIADGIVSNITGGKILFTSKIKENGNFSIPVSENSNILSILPVKIEINSGNKIMTFFHDQKDTQGIHKITFVPNARTISGQVFDENDKTKPLEGLKVKVLNQDIAVRSDKDGKFSLRGVSFDEVTVEIDDTVKIIVPKVYDSEQRLLDNIYYSGS